MSTLPKDQVVKHQDSRQRILDFKENIAIQTKWLAELKKEALAFHNRKPLNEKELIAQKAALAFKEQQITETQRMINYLEAKVRYLSTVVGE